jgi:putative ABC transport system ATP-binding protein
MLVFETPRAAEENGDGQPNNASELPISVGAVTQTSKPVKAIFRIRGISKIYHMGDVEVHALRSVDLDLNKGELAVLLGPSGSGKSTLLNIIGGLDVPTAGEVIYADHDLTRATDKQLTEYRRDHVGFVFQFYNLIPSLTALENVQLITEIAKDPMKAEDALGVVGLHERLNHFPAQLSGGEQQRGKIVLEAIERVNYELGTTTAVITHNASIAQMADRVIQIGSGQIVSIKCNETKARPSDLIW